jgi:hypothetical protein
MPYVLFSMPVSYKYEVYQNGIFMAHYYCRHVDAYNAYMEFKKEQQEKQSHMPREERMEEAMDVDDEEKPGFNMFNMVIKHPSFITYKARLASFKDWPKFMTPGAKDLAKAGLIYGGHSDRVHCFWCGIILRDWESKDGAWQEHKRWSPRCAFVNMCLPQNEALPLFGKWK